MTDILTKEKFLAWLREKPSGGIYRYMDNFGCPLAEFLKDNGIEEPWVGGFTWSEDKETGAKFGKGEHEIPPWLKDSLAHLPYEARGINGKADFSYGALIKRIKGWKPKNEGELE